LGVIRATTVIFAAMLILASQNLLAQRGGRHAGAHSSDHTGNPSASSDTDEMKDFERGFALQASPDQLSQFQVLSQHTESARKQAHDFPHMIETGSKPPEFSDPADDLKDAVQEAHDGSKEFAQKLSQPQKSAFKALTKKLAKANADVAKQGQALNQEAGRANTDSQSMAAVLKQLEEALANLRAEQLDIAKALGIQSP
jgi:hypothetical protein